MIRLLALSAGGKRAIQSLEPDRDPDLARITCGVSAATQRDVRLDPASEVPRYGNAASLPSPCTWYLCRSHGFSPWIHIDVSVIIYNYNMDHMINIRVIDRINLMRGAKAANRDPLGEIGSSAT